MRRVARPSDQRDAVARQEPRDVLRLLRVHVGAGDGDGRQREIGRHDATTPQRRAMEETRVRGEQVRRRLKAVLAGPQRQEALDLLEALLRRHVDPEFGERGDDRPDEDLHAVVVGDREP